MNEMVNITLFGWIPIVLVLFTVLRPLHAVLASFLGGWLFLPMASIPVAWLPVDLSKMSVTCYGALVGVLLFDARKFFAFRPRPIDAPMLVWCLMPMITGLANSLEWRLNASLTLSQVVMWGMPWFIGRLYLTDARAYRETAAAVVIAGLVYVPFCWYELVMSPQLHRIVYGWHQHDFIQTARGGGWRPMVFMQHGLMVAAWMMSASLVGVWLWLSGAVRRIGGVPLVWLLVPLVGTALSCKSLGALVLLGVGFCSLLAVKYLRWTGVLVALAVLPVTFMGARIAGRTGGDTLVALATMVNPDRAESLEFRLRNEDLLMRKALRRPLLGWGWGLGRVQDEWGNDEAVTDGLWIILLGGYGLVGLGALYGALLLPPAVVAWRVRKLRAPPEATAPVLALCAIAILFAVDTIPNAMVNPFFSLICGGLASGIAILSPRTGLPAARPGPAPQTGTPRPGTGISPTDTR